MTSVSREGVGNYLIEIDDSAVGVTALIPIAIAKDCPHPGCLAPAGRQCAGGHVLTRLPPGLAHPGRRWGWAGWLRQLCRQPHRRAGRYWNRLQPELPGLPGVLVWDGRSAAGLPATDSAPVPVASCEPALAGWAGGWLYEGCRLVLDQHLCHGAVPIAGSDPFPRRSDRLQRQARSECGDLLSGRLLKPG